MMTRFLATLFAGAALGAGVTWSVMRDRQPKAEIAPALAEEEVLPAEESLSHDTDADPFAYPGPSRDMKDPIQRDLCVAEWYQHQEAVVVALEQGTGHKFGPMYNRRHPVEILQEQLDFMKEFMATTEKISREAGDGR